MANSTQAPVFLDNPIILDVSSSYGAILIGIFFSSALYGVSSLQSFIYSMNCDSDSVYLKYSVLILWIADTVNQLLLYAGAWPVLVKQYGRIAGLSAVQPAIMHHVWVSHIVIFTVQMYLARRIYVFGQASARSLKSLITVFVVLIICLASFELIGVTVYEIRGYGKSLAVLSSRLEISINMALRITAATVDVSLACGMTYLLRKTSPEFQRSKKLLQRLLIIVVGSGSATALSAVLVLITVARFPNDLWYCIFDFPLVSIYLNTLLVNLNSRNYVRNGGGINTFSNIDSTGQQNSTLVLRGMGTQGSDRLIKVQQETDIKVDEVTTYGRA